MKCKQRLTISQEILYVAYCQNAPDLANYLCAGSSVQQALLLLVWNVVQDQAGQAGLLCA